MKPIDVFDGHCDTILRCFEHGGGFRKSEGHLDLERTRKFGRYAQFFAIFGDETTEPGTPLWDLVQKEYAIFQRELEKNADRLVFCRSGAEAEEAFHFGKSVAFLSVEGAELLNCDLNKLEQAYHMGVRAINLTWNTPNLLSGTNVAETKRGLSQQGRAFVRRMEALGMLVDVSHLSDPGFWDVVELSTKPFFASHSNSRAVFFNPRNLTDAQFTAIIEHNGVAGLNMYSEFLGEQANIDTVIDHLEHFLSLGGEKHVSLGGDWDGIRQTPHGISGIQDMDRLYERLLQRNYHEALLRDVFYSNLMRVVNEVCTM